MSTNKYGQGKTFQSEIIRFLRSRGFDVEQSSTAASGNVAGLGPLAVKAVNHQRRLDLCTLMQSAQAAADGAQGKIPIGIAAKAGHRGSSPPVEQAYVVMTLASLAELAATAWPELVSATALPEQPTPRPVWAVCTECGDEYEAAPNKLYCTRACRDTAQRIRRRQAVGRASASAMCSVAHLSGTSAL